MIYERPVGRPGTRPVGLVRIHRPRGRVFRPSARRRAGAPHVGSRRERRLGRGRECGESPSACHCGQRYQT